MANFATFSHKIVMWTNNHSLVFRGLDCAGALMTKVNRGYIIGARRTSHVLSERIRPGDAITFDPHGEIYIQGRKQAELRNPALAYFLIRNGIRGFRTNEKLSGCELHDLFHSRLQPTKAVKPIKFKSSLPIKEARAIYLSFLDHTYNKLTSTLIATSYWAGVACSPSLRNWLLGASLATLTHDLGHVAAAVSNNMKIESYIIGHGFPIFSFRIHNTKVDINAFPIDGNLYVPAIYRLFNEPNKLSMEQLRRIRRFYAAGIMTNVITAGAIAAGMIIDAGYQCGIAKSLLVMSILSAAFNIVPFGIPSIGFGTDGYSIREANKVLKRKMKEEARLHSRS